MPSPSLLEGKQIVHSSLWRDNAVSLTFLVPLVHICKIKSLLASHSRVCLLLSKQNSCYRSRTGEKKPKSVWGCTVDANLSVLNLVIVKKGEKDVPGLIHMTVPYWYGPKGLAKSWCFSNSLRWWCPPICYQKALKKERQKPRTKAPKIQCLITSCVLQLKTLLHYFEETTRKNMEKSGEYAKLLAKRRKDTKEKYQSARRHGLLSQRASTSKSNCSQMWVLKSNKRINNQTLKRGNPIKATWLKMVPR